MWEKFVGSLRGECDSDGVLARPFAGTVEKLRNIEFGTTHKTDLCDYKNQRKKICAGSAGCRAVVSNDLTDLVESSDATCPASSLERMEIPDRGG